MRVWLRPIISHFLIILIVAGGLLIPLSGGVAQVQECQYSFIAEAVGSGDLRFLWIGLDNGVEQFNFSEVAGVLNSSFHQVGTNILLTEVPPAGWAIDDISCSGNGFTFEVISQDSVVMTCQDGGSVGTCTFTNVKLPAPIPTLSEWGMIAAAAGLIMVGVFYALRKRKAQAV